MKSILKSIIITSLFVFSQHIVFAQDSDKTVTITSSGSGKTKDEAKQSALKSAIEQAFGAFISTKTEMFNDQVVADQMSSVSSGNIKSYNLLNESQLPDGSWGVTLKAIVSVDKLTSFVEAKGIAIEIKGGMFALNIKQQSLNELGEVKAVSEMVGLLHEPMQISFDYIIKSSEPKSLDAENKNWEIPLVVTATTNKNIDFCANYCIKTLAALSLSAEEVTSYQSLNKAVFPFEIPQQPEFEMGGGGLYSTAEDYLKFLRMVLNYGQLGGERILTPQGAVALGLNHMGDCRVYKLKAAIPLTNDAEFFPGIPKSWSLAFQINHEPAPTGRPAGGLMWAGLANSYYWLDQTNGLAGVYITQIFPFADNKSLPLYYDFEKAVYDAH